MRGNGHVFAHVDWRRMDEAQLDGMRYVAYTPTGVVDGRFAPMPTRNGLPMPYLVDEAIGFPILLLTAADLDKSLAHLETATRLTGLVVELQKAAANLEVYAASLLGSDDIIVDKAASLILHLNRKVTDRAHSMRNACENLEQSDRLLAEKAKRKSLMDHILTIPLDGEDD